MGRKKIDLTGQRFKKVVVLKFYGKTQTVNGASIWLCLCDCGNKKPIRADRLKAKKFKSCGCVMNSKEIRTKKGKKKCVCCGKNKKFIFFSKTKTMKCGYKSRCEICLKKYYKRLSVNLADTYIIALLKGNRKEDKIQPELIEAKRFQLKIHRFLKENRI